MNKFFRIVFCLHTVVKIIWENAVRIAWNELNQTKQACLCNVDGSGFSSPAIQILKNVVVNVAKMIIIKAPTNGIFLKLLQADCHKAGLCCNELVFVMDIQLIF